MSTRALFATLTCIAVSFVCSNASGQATAQPQLPTMDFGALPDISVADKSSLEPRLASSDASIDTNKPTRPAPFSFKSEWIVDSDDGLATGKLDASIPLLMFGRPPPLIKVGFGFTDLFAAEDFGIPNELYEYSLGLSWVRPINELWTVRAILGVGFATDNQNTSSDAWQFRGGAFAMYRRSPELTWTFGALATGRDDLPVIPAIGAVWQPIPETRWDFLFPQPKVNFLLQDTGTRQRWAYLGFGINGNTWAYEQATGVDDRLTYKDLRAVVGWESRPKASAGMPFALGRTLRMELGYVFSREFEFERETRVEPLGDGLVAGISAKF